MAIEKIDTCDTFARHSGFYIRKTIIDSKAYAILEPGGEIQEIAHLPEEHYQIYSKNPYDHSELIAEYNTWADAEQTLKTLMKLTPKSL